MKDFDYPGDRFSRTVALASCHLSTKNKHYIYRTKQGEIELVLNSGYFLDRRYGKSAQKIELSSLHYSSKIDSSLRFFLRGGMTMKDLRLLFGKEHENWGGVGSSMAVWQMADGRYLAVLPSSLAMPQGMQSYNILSKYQELEKVTPMLALEEQSNGDKKKSE